MPHTRGTTPRQGCWLVRTAAAGCLGVALAAGGATAAHPTEPATTFHVQGHLRTQADGTVSAVGDFVGTYRLIWQSEQSVVEYGSTTVTVDAGIDGLLGCLDRNRDGRCSRSEPQGTISMAFRRVSAYQTTTHTLIESSGIRPVIGTSGAFTGGLLFLSERASSPDGQTASAYRGELTVDGR